MDEDDAQVSQSSEFIYSLYSTTQLVLYRDFQKKLLCNLFAEILTIPLLEVDSYDR